VNTEVVVGRGAVKQRPVAWGNVLLVGGGVGVFVTAFLLVLSFIRSYVEPPKIAAPRPMLASAESTPVEITGFAGSNLSPMEAVRAVAMEDLAAAFGRGASPPPPTVNDSAPVIRAVPLPQRRPRPDTLTLLSRNVPLPRPRPRE
jgi:hypothetical protein